MKCFGQHIGSCCVLHACLIKLNIGFTKHTHTASARFMGKWYAMVRKAQQRALVVYTKVAVTKLLFGFRVCRQLDTLYSNVRLCVMVRAVCNVYTHTVRGDAANVEHHVATEAAPHHHTLSSTRSNALFVELCMFYQNYTAVLCADISISASFAISSRRQCV